jgi:hypothetical protein
MNKALLIGIVLIGFWMLTLDFSDKSKSETSSVAKSEDTTIKPKSNIDIKYESSKVTVPEDIKNRFIQVDRSKQKISKSARGVKDFSPTRKKSLTKDDIKIEKIKQRYYQKARFMQFKKRYMENQKKYARMQNYKAQLMEQRKNIRQNINKNPNINKQKEAYIKFQKEMYYRQQMIKKSVSKSKQN